VDDGDDELRFKESTTIRVRGKKRLGGGGKRSCICWSLFSCSSRPGKERDAQVEHDAGVAVKRP
jgi:hypothetical protein